MLLLTATTDKIQAITSVAVAVDVHVSYVDASNAVPPVIQGDTMGRLNTAISTATTTDICAAPAASEIRNVKYVNVRNKGASATDVTIQFNQNGTLYELFKATLNPGEVIEFVEGIGWFVVQQAIASRVNFSTAAVSAAFASDTYVTGSYVKFPSGGPIAGARYSLIMDITKTGAGTAAPTWVVRTGTAGTTADTSRHSLALGAGSAAADTGKVKIDVIWRSVGASGVSIAMLDIENNLASTGLCGVAKQVSNVATAYDTTVASLGIGVSFNGGASFSGTVQQVRAEYVALVP